MTYGPELLLDLEGCDVSLFNRADLEVFLAQICDVIGMVPEDLHFWDYEGIPEEERDVDPKVYGTSAIQFLRTSNVTIHTLDKLGLVFLNVFSCRSFDLDAAAVFAAGFFSAEVTSSTVVWRGSPARLREVST